MPDAEVKPQRVVAVLRSWLVVLDSRTRRRLGRTLPLSVVVAFGDLAGIGLILPLITVLTADEPVGSGVLGALSRFVGTTQRSVVAGLLVVFILVVFLVKSILSLVFLRWQAGILSEADAAASSQLHGQYLRNDYVDHLGSNTSDLAYDVKETVEEFHFGLGLAFLNIFGDAVSVVLIVALLVVVQPVAASMTSLILLLTGALYALGLHRWVRRLGDRSWRLNVEFSRVLQESLLGFKIIRALGREPHFIQSYGALRRGFATTRRDLAVAQALPKAYLEVVLVTMVLAVALVTVGSSPDTAVPRLGLFVAAGLRLLPPLQRLFSSLGSVQSGAWAVAHLREELARTAPAATRGGGDTSPLHLRQRFELRGVGFSYPGASSAALHDVSLVVERGAAVGVVGTSGAGKTTLMDVVLGLLAPTHGALYVDGAELTGDDVPRWRSSIGYAPQDVFLFDGSIVENIVMGLEPSWVDEVQVERAVTLAQLQDVIRSLPDGLDTLVGERGVRLSGGQRQRVGIARALYARPEVLLLDEATSSLDVVTEARLVDDLRRLRGELTVIVVAHRLTTVRDCDVLYLLEGGTVVDSGSFLSLHERSTAFQHLVARSSVERADVDGPRG